MLNNSVISNIWYYYFSIIFNREEFLHLQFEQLSELLEDNELNVTSEEQVILGLIYTARH